VTSAACKPSVGRPAVRHGVVHADARLYSAHPHLAVAADGAWLLVFNQAPRRTVVLHPPLDPAFRNVVMRSTDEGQSWSAPLPVTDADRTGVECAGLTPLADGSVLLNQWQFGWGEIDDFDIAAEDLATPEDLARQWTSSREFEGLHDLTGPGIHGELFRSARCGGRCTVSVASNPAAPFEYLTDIDTSPFSGGYGMRGGIILDDGEIVLPLSDVPHYRSVFVVRSRDGGRTWSTPVAAASVHGHAFEEPAPIRLENGDTLMMLRENTSRILHAVRSSDGGRSWSAPYSTGIRDYPAHLIRLRDGRLAMVAGRRRSPFGVALYLADADGTHWHGPMPVRDDLPDRDLGYPVAAERGDGDLVVIYYGRDTAGTTAILSTVVAADALQNRVTSHVSG
jgi:hypothetical protein